MIPEQRRGLAVLPRLILLSGALLCVVAAWLSKGLVIDDSLFLSLPSGPLAEELQRGRRLFPESDHIILALPAADPFSPESLMRLSTLTRQLEAAAEKYRAPGAEEWRVVSPASMNDFSSVEGEIRSQLLIPREAPDGAALRERLSSSSLLSRIFLATRHDAWLIYLDTELEGRALLDFLGTLRHSFPELQLGGRPYYHALQGQMLRREFPALLGLSALVLLLVEWWLIGEFFVAVSLWLFSLAPTIVLIGLLPVTGTSLSISLVLAPIITLAISTSYTTHLYHGWAINGRDPYRALRSRGDLIFLDALTTLLGFGSLLLSPLRELRVLGAFSAIGVGLALVSSTVGLSAYLRITRRRTSIEAIYAKGLSPMETPSPRARGVRLACWILLFGASLLAAFPLGTGKSYRDLFLPASREGREVAFFAAESRGIDEIGLVVETGREYGLVDLALFQTIERLERRLSQLEGIGSVYGYTDLVGEALARWDGQPGQRAPVSEVEIGETLELLAAYGSRTFDRGLLSPDWSACRISITLNSEAKNEEVVASIRQLAAQVELPGRTWLTGISLELLEMERLFIQGQAAGMVFFFAVLVLILIVYFRSFRRAILVAAVPATGVLTALALMGIMGWSVSEANSAALAAVAGIGVDDAIMSGSRGKSRETRRAIMETTLLVCSGVGVLLLSTSFIMVQSAIISIVGMTASTALSLFALPEALGDPPIRS